MKRLMIFISLALILASCSAKENAHIGKNNASGSLVNLQIQGHQGAVTTPYKMRDGKVWIPADQAAELFGYRYELEPASQSASMGYMDPIYRFKLNSKQAHIGDEPLMLHEAPQLIDHKLYLETNSLSQLWQTPLDWDAKLNSIVVTPPAVDEPDRSSALSMPRNTLRAKALDTDDSQWDPNDNTDGNPDPDGNSGGNQGGNTEPGADAEKVISFAKQFMAIPYKFDAAPYAESRKFDCSSFVQHVFDHVGIELPRSSRAQSKIGQYVAREHFKPGDAVFFYTPGRYSSNKIVGHVGIYIGNNQVIHTYGSPGVTISELEGSWNDRVLWGRRVL
ncbi:C40 family peptidase [Paenibacillus lignilyticus]|uniref:C40 family peptidase n=1 Tax=Paenibacillus lignilyticus TaxID=1172615 RepID=A0ABS5CJV8_9BACL|nr:NlpC/P60 family protein [Paenibacillus lignilyticus]MBP3966170.1 C40 family peptidase [Paenibacillus lignilyticus]